MVRRITNLIWELKGLTHTFYWFRRSRYSVGATREAVYSALRVQLALVVCCAPIYSKTYQSHLVVKWRTSVVLLYSNLKLYPFLTVGKLVK